MPELLAALDAFLREHRRRRELGAIAEPDRVWGAYNRAEARNRLSRIAFLVLTIAFLAAGCISGTRALTSSESSRIRRLAVVPMESPPLEVHPRLATTFPVAVSGLVLAPAPLQPGGMVLGSVFGLLMLADLPRAAKGAAAKAESVECLLKDDATWSPSVVLAEYLVTRLRESAIREVTMIDSPRAFPGLEHRERTVMMRSWWVPIRDKWYNVDASPIDYSEFAAQGVDGILEVAVAGYTVTEQSSVASDILIKLSDPRTGKLLARTRQYIFSCGNMSHPFDNKAQELKLTIPMCIDALSDQALKAIGLLPLS